MRVLAHFILAYIHTYVIVCILKIILTLMFFRTTFPRNSLYFGAYQQRGKSAQDIK
jgi:hypothetical protein